MAIRRVKTIIGTMGVGTPLDEKKTKQVLDIFSRAGHTEIDTALMYQGGNTEKVLGKIGVCSDPRFKVATKVNPWYSLEKKSTMLEVAKGLRKEAILEQARISLASLQTNKVSLLYLHAPDPDTPIEETLEAINVLYQEGKFEEWGLSNYAAWQVVHIYHLCKSKGYPLPSVYQGMYNYLTRDVERELFPALRTCGMRFYAYNPLAGGILTGRYTYEDDPNSGRFTGKTVWGNRYRDRYWRKAVFEQLNRVTAVCASVGVDPTSAALRWAYHHSQLKGELGDGVIIGGSSVEQLSTNITACTEGGPLPAELVEVMESAWLVAKPDCPQYFR